MSNLYNLYYNKDMKNAISVKTKKYYNTVMRKNAYYVAITTANATITYHFDEETNEITNRFADCLEGRG